MTIRKYNFSSPIKQHAFQVRDLLGVDFTTHESEVEQRRSPDAVNLISGLQGSVDKRFGTGIIKKFEGKIWAVHNIKTFVYGTTIMPDGIKERIEVNVTIVHEGTRLWAYNPHLDTWQQARTYNGTTYSTTVLQERQTNFIEWNNQSYFTIIHNNWTNSISELLILYCTGSTYSGEEGTIWFDVYLNDPMNFLLYIPTTAIARSPSGLNSTKFQSSNLMTNACKNKFLSDASSTVYKLDYGACYGYISSNVTVFQMQADGSFSSALHDASNNPITATLTEGTNIVTFSAVPHATYKTGVDNIEIWFRRDSVTKTVSSQINYYQSYASYGLNGLSDNIFFCNSIEQRNMNKEIWLTAIKDTDDWDRVKMYVAFNSFSLLGSNRKIGYSKVGQYLVLHGQRDGSSPVAYLKTASIDDNGELFIRSVPTTSQVGAIAPKSFANLRDDPLFISEAGVTATLIDTITNIQSMQDRGFYVNKKLLEEPNLDKAISFIFDNKYFTCVNGNIYIADPRYKSIDKMSYSESFQYEWYYWEGLDVQSYSVVDGELLFGTTDGRLMRYKNDQDNYPYCDEIIATPSLWASGNSYVKGDVVKSGSDYYICLVPNDSSYIALVEGKYWHEIIPIGLPTLWSADHVSYALDQVVIYNGNYYKCIIAHTSDVSLYPTGIGVTMWEATTEPTTFHFQVPVLAYWTTPIMNIGDTTMRKTLKNLWVRLGKYARMSARIYYSTQGIVSEKYDGIFDFSDIDFSRFTFSTDTDPSVLVTNRAERKFMSIQFKVESRDEYPFSLLEIVGKYTFNNQFKG